MITLKNHSLQASILPLGATLAGLWYKGAAHSLILGSVDPKDYCTSLTYSGACVGPIANRVRDGKVLIAGEVWRIPPNENANALHSGAEGLHTRIWGVVAQSDVSVTLQTKLSHGDGGLPGNRVIEASYTLTEASSLRIDIQARSDADTAMNIAHHPYWNLDGTDTVAEHQLKVFAESFLPVDQETLPTGEINSVAGTSYDFRCLTPIPVDDTLDANLCLSTHQRARPQPAALLQGATGRRLEIATTEPGLQVYNGAGLTGEAAGLHPGQSLTPYSGVALEPQAWPDAPHHAHFPCISLRKGDTYRQTTLYRIS